MKFTRHVYELGDIMVIEFKIFQLEKMFDIPQITRHQVIHGYNIISFLNEPVAEMGT
jgi:hypothetical protein